MPQQSVTPMEDHAASADFRRALTRELVARVVEEAVAEPDARARARERLQ